MATAEDGNIEVTYTDVYNGISGANGFDIQAVEIEADAVAPISGGITISTQNVTNTSREVYVTTSVSGGVPPYSATIDFYDDIASNDPNNIVSQINVDRTGTTTDIYSSNPFAGATDSDTGLSASTSYWWPVSSTTTSADVVTYFHADTSNSADQVVISITWTDDNGDSATFSENLDLVPDS